jgi:hypothetical protein
MNKWIDWKDPMQVVVQWERLRYFLRKRKEYFLLENKMTREKVKEELLNFAQKRVTNYELPNDWVELVVDTVMNEGL